ncbi:unnamed protein product [Heligmosomoides polygyrus]|uniref:Macro domain-containing protein n=1 Tax=Heligmosomoides polygyrus TaxID=6339 RepID=A0A183GUD8_HELPZ|nr:unnamed protein product [Heligmosomoides polygyrus]
MYELSIGPLGDWNGTAKVIAKSGNIFREKVDAVCVSVSSTLEHSSAVWKAISKEAGLNEYKAAFVKARDAVGHWLSRGEVLVVNTTATKLSAKFVFLVVHPDIHHLEAAHRSVFREAAARQCSSIAIPGLGCGRPLKLLHYSLCCLVPPFDSRA